QFFETEQEAFEACQPEIPDEIAGPDLVVTDVWQQDGVICYQIMNAGNQIAQPGHSTALLIDGQYSTSDLIQTTLEPDDRLTRCFTMDWTCTPLEDSVSIQADHNDIIAEKDEANNRRNETWQCDDTAPQIVAGPWVSGITQNSAVISWETDEPSDSVVLYGSAAGYYPDQELDPSLVVEHTVPLGGLDQGTLYHFSVLSTDPNGNTAASGDNVFETLPSLDDAPPTVTVTDPGKCQGMVTIGADAHDDTGVEKVEFYIGDALMFTDYSPPYEFVLDSEEYPNGMHDLMGKAIDVSGKSSADDLDIDVDNPVDKTAPTVTITEPKQDDTISGKVTVKANLQDDSGLAHAFFKVDGQSEAYEGLTSNPKQKDVSFEWDTASLESGKYRLAVEAFDKDGKYAFDTVDVVVSHTPPALPPKLKIKKREVTRHNNYFTIKLTVENVGSGEATNIIVEDFLRSFQPISASKAEAEYEAEFIHTTLYNGCIITSQVNLLPKQARTYVYTAVPVLIHPNAPTPSIGDSVKLWYESKDGTEHYNEYAIKVLKTTSGKTIKAEYDAALKSADYLIVTNPNRMFTQSPFYYYHREYNEVLSDMAKLATYSQGVLGYVNIYSASTLRDLVKPGGDWAKRLQPSFSVPLGGYLLIVGETEIMPSWTHGSLAADTSASLPTLPVNYSDHPYADTGGDPAPDLIVGRIIDGGALQTSIGVHEGVTKFDRSDALLVSGIEGTCYSTWDFKDDVIDIGKTLSGTYGCNVKLLHLAHFGGGPTGYYWKQKFSDNTPDKDIVVFRGKGLIDQWIPGITAFQFWTSFGNTRPFVFAATGSAGDYESNDYTNMAQALFNSGAAVYVGSTSESLAEHLRYHPGHKSALPYIIYCPYDYHNSYATREFFETWSKSETVGKAFTELERSLLSQQPTDSMTMISYHGGAFVPSSKNKDFWQYWVSSYNLYGDPKFGASPSKSTAGLTQDTQPQFAASYGLGYDTSVRFAINVASPDVPRAASKALGIVPVSSLDVVIPDYEVAVSNSTAWVEIPNGDVLLVPGQPLVPYRTVSVDYPKGYRVQSVELTNRSGLHTDSGLNIPILADSAPASASEEGWFPNLNTDFGWHTIDNPDGTTTLIIAVYPFHYNSRTTDVKYYKNYSFSIEYAISTLEIASLATNEDVYEQGDSVTANVYLDNSGEAQDVVVSASISSYGSEQIADGLPLLKLKGVGGPASVSLLWKSDGFDAGYYTIQVDLRDRLGQLLDSKTDMFRLGMVSGEITYLGVMPHSFDASDDISVSLGFSNTGTVSISGTAIINVQSEAGETVKQLTRDFADLAPSDSISIDETWDTSEAEPGSYAIVASVSYESMATAPSIITVHTEGPTRGSFPWLWVAVGAGVLVLASLGLALWRRLAQGTEPPSDG
ncbi:Ig-like domain-containing protein, partial [Chloroflexota bacterium]